MEKRNNYLKYAFVGFVVIFWICIFHLLFSYKTELNNGYTIRRTAISQRLALYNPKKEKIITGIADWVETERYIYGYGDEWSNFKYYLFDKELNNTLLFDNDDFYEKLHELNLHYYMSDSHSDENPFPPIWKICSVITQRLFRQ